MADRSILALSKIDDFKDWLVSDGWKLQKTEGVWEVLRAKKEGRKNPLIVYKRLSSDNGNELVHLTVLDRDIGTVKAYLKNRRTDNG